MIMARENSMFTFTFTPDGSGAVVTVAGHSEPLTFSFTGYSSTVRQRLLEHGFKQIMADSGAGAKTKGLTPAMIADHMRARHSAFCHGMWTMKDAGFDFADLASAVIATRGLTEADRPRVEGFLLKMETADRERLRRLPTMARAIAQARVDRLAALPDAGDGDGPDPLAGL